VCGDRRDQEGIQRPPESSRLPCFQRQRAGVAAARGKERALQPSPPLTEAAASAWGESRPQLPAGHSQNACGPRGSLLGQKGRGEGGTIPLRGAGHGSAGGIPVASAAGSLVMMFLYPKVEKKYDQPDCIRLSEERKGSCRVVLQSLYSERVSQAYGEGCARTKAAAPSTRHGLASSRARSHQTPAAPRGPSRPGPPDAYARDAAPERGCR